MTMSSSLDSSGTVTGTAANRQIRLRARIPALLLGLVLFLAIFFPDRLWTSMLVILGGLFLVAYFWCWQLSNGLRATRQLRFGWVAVGDRLEEAFAIVNDAEVPALWVEIVDESNVPGYHSGTVRSVGVRQSDRWKQAAICRRRGSFHLGPWAIRTSDPFGIFGVTLSYPRQQEIIIHPPIHAGLPIPLPLGQSDGRVRARRKALQTTINVASVRDYQHGDPYKWIHWPTSARHGELHVREFDLDAAGDIWLLLDLQRDVQLGQEAEGTEEHAVLLAASLAARAERNRRAVGLAAYGAAPRVVPPARGRGQQWNILRALALVKADGAIDVGAALADLARVAQRGAAVVVITANASTGWLPQLARVARQNIRPHVILLDRASFGGAGNSAGLRDTIHALGFEARVVGQGEVGQPVDEEERRGFWEFRVLGTGKVVTVRSPIQRQVERV